MSYMAFFFPLLLAVSTYGQTTPFQNNISECLNSRIDKKIAAVLSTSKIKTLDDLYLFLDKHYSLRTAETIFREVEFVKNGEAKKLKLEKGKIKLLKVQDDGTLVMENNDARQRGLTDESSINQLLVGAEIKSDWLKATETRLGKYVLQYSRQQGKITALQFEKRDQTAKLECSRVDLSDVCLCRP